MPEGTEGQQLKRRGANDRLCDEVASLKRKRPSDSPPSEGLSGPGDEPGLAPETKQTAGQLLLCEVAQQALQKYSLGVRCIPLEELGVSPLNRHVSATHVHDLGRRICSVEGFARFRYRNGWAHQPNPQDLLEVARHTNRVARATPLLAPVPMVALKGSFAKDSRRAGPGESPGAESMGWPIGL